MQIRRSQLEADTREAGRKELAKKVASAFKHDPFAARIIEPKKEEKRTATPTGVHCTKCDWSAQRKAQLPKECPECGGKVVADNDNKTVKKKEASAQEQNLSRQAIHFASNTFKDLGLHNISLAPGAVTPSDSLTGPKLNLIRSATVKLKGSVKKAQDHKIIDKPFEVNMSFENGKFSVDSLQKNDQLFPINKGSLEKVTAMQDDEEEEQDSEDDNKEASIPDKENQKKPGVPTGKSTPLCPKCGSKLTPSGKCPNCNYHADM